MKIHVSTAFGDYSPSYTVHFRQGAVMYLMLEYGGGL